MTRVTSSRVAFDRHDNHTVPAPPDGTATATNSSLFIDANDNVHITSRRVDGRIAYTLNGRSPLAVVWAVAAKHLP